MFTSPFIKWGNCSSFQTAHFILHRFIKTIQHQEVADISSFISCTLAASAAHIGRFVWSHNTEQQFIRMNNPITFKNTTHLKHIFIYPPFYAQKITHFHHFITSNLHRPTHTALMGTSQTYINIYYLTLISAAVYCAAYYAIFNLTQQSRE